MKVTRYIYNYNGEEVAVIGKKEDITMTKAKQAIIDLIKKERGQCDTTKIVYKKCYDFDCVI